MNTQNIKVHTVVAPMAKATTSVIEVTVIETPACCNVSPILSCNDRLLSDGDKLFQH